MLKGLDATILNLSEVKADNAKLRIDDGYFSKLAVFTHQRIEGLPHIRLGEVCEKFRKGIFDIKAASYVDEGVPFVRIGDLKGGLIDESNLSFISEAVHIKEAATALVYGDVILSKTAYAAAALVNLPRCNVSQDTIAVQIEHAWRKKLLSGYLVTFLNTKHGLALLNRQFQGNVQAHLSLPDGRKLPVPLFSEAFQKSVHSTLLRVDALQIKARESLKKAEQILLLDLGLADWKPPGTLTYIRRASEVMERGRYDAEHYHEQFYALTAKLREYRGGVATLGALCPNPMNGVEIREYTDTGVPYLRVGDIKNYTVSTSSLKYVSHEAAAEQIEKVRLQEGDVLVSRSGSLAVTGVVETEWTHAVISSHLILVRIQDADYRPEYVAAFLAAMPGKMQIIQHSNGGVQPEINQPSLKRVLIPRLAPAIQEEIISKIRQAHQSRQEAQSLLAKAKHAVEVAIEESEVAALNYMKGN